MNSNNQESSNLKRYNSAPQINKLDANNKPQMSLPSLQPTSFSNIFTPRARRFSASFSPSPLASPNIRKPTTSNLSSRQDRPTDRVNGDRINQLKKAECGEDLREINHEREVHTQFQMSASYEDLTLVTENWSFKNNYDDISNLMNSPRMDRNTNLRFPYHHMSPSPTRKTFATRRSASPCSMRPSTLSGVKRKFELYETACSPPPFKRIFSDRGPPSPSICPSPSPSDSSHEGFDRPKVFASKIFSNTNTNSLSSLSSGNESETTCLLMDNSLVPIGSDELPIAMDEVSEENTKKLSTSLVQEQKSVDKLSVNLTDNDKMLV